MLLGVGVTVAAPLQRIDNPDSGLVRWRLTWSALHVELAQRLPDQTRGFFLARGVPAPLADAFARACVFQVIARNRGEDATLELDTRAWRVRQQGIEQPLPDKRDWLREWRAAGLSNAAALAFRWATFPTTQGFAPGDYNWGMIGFGPAPGERFDLKLVWREDGVVESHWIEDLRCAEDK